MSANVGCEVLVYAGILADACQHIAVIGKAYLGKLPIVALQYLDDGWEEHHVVLGAGLDTGGSWNDECAIVFFGLGEVGLHQVGIAEAGVALHYKEVECFVIGWSGWCPCAEGVQLVHGEVGAWLCLESALFELGVGILLDNAVGDGFVDEGTEAGMVGLNGIALQWFSGLDAFMCFEPIIEGADVGKGDVGKGADSTEHFKEIDKNSVLSVGGSCGPLFFCALDDEVDEGCTGLVGCMIVQHGKGEVALGVEAFCIDVVHLATECVYLVVEGIGIGTAYDAAVLELAFVDFDSCTYKFALLVVADF